MQEQPNLHLCQIKIGSSNLKYSDHIAAKLVSSTDFFLKRAMVRPHGKTFTTHTTFFIELFFPRTWFWWSTGTWQISSSRQAKLTVQPMRMAKLLVTYSQLLSALSCKTVQVNLQYFWTSSVFRHLATLDLCSGTRTSDSKAICYD